MAARTLEGAHDKGVTSVIRVKVNGTKYINILVDSGSNASIISLATLNSLNLEPEPLQNGDYKHLFAANCSVVKIIGKR